MKNHPLKKVKRIAQVIVFIFLTVVTQIGGVVFVLNLLLHKIKPEAFGLGLIIRRIVKLGTFIVLYLLATFVIVPLIASRTHDRVPLPFTKKDHLKPLTIWTCLLNRHYVNRELKDVALTVALEMNTRYPGTITNYLDANFPFFNPFPMYPHLSHKDGNKLDFAFYYSNSTGNPVNDAPSFMGYGISEEPKPGELDMSKECGKRGQWQYSFLNKYFSPGKDRSEYVFNQDKTKTAILLFTANKKIDKLFIEPHLKERMRLNSNKVRFQGCHSVRHDDHFHIEMANVTAAGN